MIQKLLKSHLKIDAKIDAGKNEKMTGKVSEKDLKMDQKGIQNPVFSRKAGLAQMYVLPG